MRAARFLVVVAPLQNQPQHLAGGIVGNAHAPEGETGAQLSPAAGAPAVSTVCLGGELLENLLDPLWLGRHAAIDDLHNDIELHTQRVVQL